jgi:hypothetical protein
MSVSSLESSTEAEEQDLLVNGDEMDRWTVTIQEVASISSKDQEKQKQQQKQKNDTQKISACEDTNNFLGMTISDENLSQEREWSNSRNGYSQDGSATKFWQRKARHEPRKRKPLHLKDYGTASSGRARASQAEDVSLFEESSDSNCSVINQRTSKKVLRCIWTKS